MFLFSASVKRVKNNGHFLRICIDFPPRNGKGTETQKGICVSTERFLSLIEILKQGYLLGELDLHQHFIIIFSSESVLV
jgi:hypothetical protein